MKFLGALRHPAEPRVLLVRSGAGWRLPRASVRQTWIASAGAIGEAFERRLGTRAWLLRQLRFSANEAVVELELAEPGWQPPANARWTARDELARVRDGAERELLDGYLAALGDVPPARAPWALPGWRGRVLAWIEREAARLGHRVVGVEQVKQWSISSILRVRTDGPLLYLKVSARLPLFVDEGPVTAELARRFPGQVPEPLAHEPDEGWFLLADLGDEVGWDAPLDVRAEMFRSFAGLQRATVDAVDELLAAGCLDRRLPSLANRIEPLLADDGAVRKLEPAEVDELRRRAPELADVCRRLDGLGLPPTLVHGDLHLGNVARPQRELVFFDWTDACIAHPFVDLHSLQWERDAANREALLDAYLSAWDGIAPEETLREAVRLAAVATPLHHAVSYRTIATGVEASAGSELDATHEFLREALGKLHALSDT